MSFTCNDSFLCILNTHVAYQFRMLQCRICNLWKIIAEQKNKIDYTEKYYTALKECIRQHQSLIKFCDKLQNVYTLPIFAHVVVFSLLMCIEAYEILLVRLNNGLIFKHSRIQFTVKHKFVDINTTILIHLNIKHNHCFILYIDRRTYYNAPHFYIHRDWQLYPHSFLHV